MTITKVDKATNRRSRRVKRPDKFVSPSEEHFGCTSEYIVRNHGRMSAASQKQRLHPITSCVRRELPTHNFIRVVDFPDDCDSKLDECFGHTTEVIRRRIAIRQLMSGLELTEETPAPRTIKPIPVVSHHENVVLGEQDRRGQSYSKDGWYHYVAGGVHTGS